METIEKIKTYTPEEIEQVERLTKCFRRIIDTFVVRKEDDARVRALNAIAGMIEKIENPQMMLKVEEPEKPNILTGDVFEHPDCPKWARFAGVDREGFAAWMSHRPEWNGYQFRFGYPGNEDIQIKNIPGKWDAKNWRSSLIERPMKW